MSDTMLRELGAEKRMFTSPRAALLWYRDQVTLRLRQCVILEVGSAPRSTEVRNTANATYAAMACVTKGIPHLGWLVAWYETTWGDGTFLADEAGITRWAFTRRCRKTERELRSRLESAGLMEDDNGR